MHGRMTQTRQIQRIEVKASRSVSLFTGILCFVLISIQSGIAAQSTATPNVIVILTDDLGYGDLGSYGSQVIATPHLDQMAEEGIRLTSAYASGSNCTPSRAGLLTGRYPIRTGMAHQVLFVEDSHGLPLDEITIAEMLKPRGYQTAIIGKWHLGHTPEYWPLRQGFDFFYGLPYSNNQTDLSLYRNDQKIKGPVDQATLTRRYTEETIGFIETNRDKPFFVYLAHTMPHVPLAASEPFKGRSKAGLYGDVVETLDWSTGEILAALRRLELDQNTLVIFTSDNGPYQGGSTGGLRGTKGTPWEGGYRVPFIARWPGRIPAGVSHDGISMNFDILPTIQAISGASLPDDLVIDGKDLMPMFQGESDSPHEKLYLFSDERIAGVRTQQWKTMLRARYRGIDRWLPEHDVRLLFDMAAEPFERYSQAAHREDVWSRMMKHYDEGVEQLQSLALHLENSDASTVIHKNLNQAKVCKNRNPHRNAYFGDLHVHTSLSTDAYQQGVRTMPRDAYDYARGKEVSFHDTVVRLKRPLDFAAVTDHASYLGELNRCLQENDPLHHSQACDEVRQGRGAAFQILENAYDAQQSGTRVQRVIRALKILFESENPRWNDSLCGPDGKLCAAAATSAWQEIVTAAEKANAPGPECGFTSFIAYEYSGVKTGSNYHRNIIFRTADVPAVPVSYLDARQDYQLWNKLDESCPGAMGGCEYLSIPHNSNLSNGKLLTPDYSSSTDYEGARSLALLRQRSEPLMEIFQHKGQSECINGISGADAEYDVLCEFEQVRSIGGSTTVLGAELITEDCGDRIDDGGMIDTGCVSRNDYLRGALLTGLQEHRIRGVNPLKLGVIASTDTHESTPGAVDEQSWSGHVGREKTLEKRLQTKTGLPYRLDGSPGGLAGVWAIQNSREALFDAMKNRETFGTSGPRIQPRFFAGWSFASDLCEADDFVSRAYEQGVPMGADLHPRPDETSIPRFAVSALMDPEGNLLQKLQIIKGALGVDGTAYLKVFDVSGHVDDQASVDLTTGNKSGPGSRNLCTVWVDDEFNPEEAAYYYMRVIENPSLRWSWAQCIALPAADRPAECENDAPKTLRERAWTSPIWYTP